jgi:hypothetical protein
VLKSNVLKCNSRNKILHFSPFFFVFVL